MPWLLDVTWAVSAVVFAMLSVFLGSLGYLERPLKYEAGPERMRQVYVCSALLLEATALMVRAVWFVLKIEDNAPRGLTAIVLLSVTSRVSECLQYASCLVMVWQWALLCARILNWDSAALKRFYYGLIVYFLTFSGLYIGTTSLSKDPRVKDNVFDTYDDLSISCECATTCTLPNKDPPSPRPTLAHTGKHASLSPTQTLRNFNGRVSWCVCDASSRRVHCVGHRPALLLQLHQPRRQPLERHQHGRGRRLGARDQVGGTAHAAAARGVVGPGAGLSRARWVLVLLCVRLLRPEPLVSHP